MIARTQAAGHLKPVGRSTSSSAHALAYKYGIFASVVAKASSESCVHVLKLRAKEDCKGY